MKSTLYIALGQINSAVGDLEGNVKKIIDAINIAYDNNCHVIIFPELAICGYPPEDLLLNRHFLYDCKKHLRRVCDYCDKITAVVGFPELKNNNLYNALAILNRCNIVKTYHKAELPNYGVFDEKRYFTQGKESPVFKIGDIPFITTICEDIWIFDSSTFQIAKRGDIKIVFNSSASPFYAGKIKLREGVITKFAKQTKTFVCYTNLVGGQDELVFDGGSMVVSPDGKIIASAERFKEDILITEISVEPPSCNKKTKYIGLLTKTSSIYKPIQPQKARELSSNEEIYSALVLGVRDYTLKNGFERVVLGLSGGIDSSLTCCIAVDAVGKKNVIGVTMPSVYTSSETLSDSKIIAKNLGIKLMTIPIKSIFSAYLRAFKKMFKSDNFGIEAENIQARIRGSLLMSLSNRFGWLVLTTGNKSEVSTGYCTLYGDTAGGFAVLKDVPKTIVYKLAEYVNNRAGKMLIPQSVIDRPPTAELKPNQRDQDTLPPYPVLDTLIHAYVEEDKSFKELKETGIDEETIKKVITMVNRSEYKRRQSPPGVKITPRAFGKDRRMPITNVYTKDEKCRKNVERLKD
ncbi:MAG: NAD+ synthase [Candidatus Hydrogenedentota bacterium]